MDQLLGKLGIQPKREQDPLAMRDVGMFGMGGNKEDQAYNQMARKENARAKKQNKQVQQREALIDARQLENLSDAQLVQLDQEVQWANRNKLANRALMIGGAAGTAGLLNAFAQQQQEELPTDMTSVMARGSNNAMAGLGGIGMDPMANMRRNLQQAQKDLGSAEAVKAYVEALPAADGTSARFGTDIDFEAEVDAKAAELMQMGSVDSNGNFVPMKPNQAFDQAYRIVSQSYNLNELY
jgi:hypothetical protein